MLNLAPELTSIMIHLSMDNLSLNVALAKKDSATVNCAVFLFVMKITKEERR